MRSRIACQRMAGSGPGNQSTVSTPQCGVGLIVAAAFVSVIDERQGTSIEIEVDPAHARDAFLHPFAYANADEFALAA